mmetsp:Transcript_19943/g.75338  ORF Transcript_19943/g.75338 Transcript_19943/m.75338 type:complete len:372 (-) Transcript_19943:78-1193(-)
MAFVQPRASTAGSFFTIALRFAMRITPRASVTVTQMGRPSGMAATARLTPIWNMDRRLRPRRYPMRLMRPMTPKLMMLKLLPSSSILSCSGVFGSSMSRSSAKVVPNSVCMPVAVTTARAFPAVTSVPMNTMFEHSAMATFSPDFVSTSIRSAFFVHGFDSPVRLDSSVMSPLLEITRASAATRSPETSSKMSPGTTSLASTLMTTPLRRTFVLGGTRSSRAASACSLRYSCTKATVDTMMTARVMLMASSNCRSSRLTPALASRSRIMGSLNCPKNFWTSVSSGSFSISLRPCRSRSWNTRSLERPSLAITSMAWSTSSGIICDALAVSIAGAGARVRENLRNDQLIRFGRALLASGSGESRHQQARGTM